MIFGSLRRLKTLGPLVKHLFSGLIEKAKEMAPVLVKKIKENAPAILDVVDKKILQNPIVKEQVHEILPSGIGEKAMNFISSKVPKLKTMSSELPSFLNNKLNAPSIEEENDDFDIEMDDDL